LQSVKSGETRFITAARGAPVEMLDAEGIVKISEQVVEQAAGAGNCVIVGRG
jgi:hypothetical protein